MYFSANVCCLWPYLKDLIVRMQQTEQNHNSKETTQNKSLVKISWKFISHLERSGSKKSRAAEAAPALQSWVPSSLGFLLFNYPGILCMALLSRWVAIVSAITSTFQEVEWRKRRKSKFTSFQKISWKVHTSHLVDSHWLEHWHMAAASSKVCW